MQICDHKETSRSRSWEEDQNLLTHTAAAFQVQYQAAPQVRTLLARVMIEHMILILQSHVL